MVGLFSDYRASFSLKGERLFDGGSQENATTIPAGTLRLLLTSIGYRAKARKEIRRKPSMVPRRPPFAGLPRRVEGARSPAAWRGKHRDRRRADPVQVETLTPPGLDGLRSAALSGMDP